MFQIAFQIGFFLTRMMALERRSNAQVQGKGTFAHTHNTKSTSITRYSPRIETLSSAKYFKSLKLGVFGFRATPRVTVCFNSGFGSTLGENWEKPQYTWNVDSDVLIMLWVNRTLLSS